MLQEKLSDLHEKGSKFICPADGPGRGLESCLFDPNSCACMQHDGMKKTQWKKTTYQSPLRLQPCYHNRKSPSDSSRESPGIVD